MNPLAMSVVPLAATGNVARMNSLVTTSGSVMNFQYDRHDVNVTQSCVSGFFDAEFGKNSEQSPEFGANSEQKKW